MKTKITSLLTLLLVIVVQITFAQERTISGTVTDGSIPLPGVNIIIKGTSVGTQTDFDGSFSIQANGGQTLTFSYIGMKTTEMVVGNSSTINVVLETDNTLDEVVITALGIKREKKSLGYATQELKGEDLTKVNTGNLANSISGKISGIEIRRNSNIGGSTNVVIRGTNSLTRDNQALWVVDGIPINNDNTNTSDQRAGGNTGGYDYGNAASDINPDDIETMTVLKGAAASALYGSRAINGVIIVTTKKGKKGKGLGVTINSSLTIGSIDSDTAPEYQKEYGSGWWDPYTDPSNNINLGGGSHPFEMTDDASWGPAYDPNLLVYRWNSFYPELSTYGVATPWTAPKNDPNSFFKNSVTYTNSVSLDAASDNGSFRLSYTKYDQGQGILPNSSYKKDNFNFSTTYKLSPKLTASASANYTKTDGKGLNETGYGAGGNNFLSSIRQWFSSSVDFKDLERAYNETGRNTTWNVWGPTDLGVAFHDNPYWQRDKNFNNVNRNRFLGNFSLTNEITDWMSATARGGIDTYNQIQEERIAVGSKRNAQLAGQYSRFDKVFREFNLDLMLNFNTKITENLDFTGLLGGNVRRLKNSSTFASTKGGLVIPEIYSISNSKSTPDPMSESLTTTGSNSVYANASFSFYDTYFLEGTYRIDKSSTLPSQSNVYKYPSITGTYIFSKHTNFDWLSFGKLRVNYAETGSDADFAILKSTYDKLNNFNGQPQFSTEDGKKNADLKSETLSGYEAGLELKLFDSRIGLDLSLYKTNTKDQVINVGSSAATGFTSAWVNAGEIENRGVEVGLNIIPIKTKDFSWESQINWSTNKSEVVSLDKNLKSLEIGRFQGISLMAVVGEPVGTLRSSGFQYVNGKRVVGANGNYVRLTNQTIGDVNPDWMGGINNKFRYKNLSLSFLIDMKKGGNVWSLDQKYGTQTGIYKNTVGPNHLGNPMRDPVTTGADSGGIILDGVLADGSPNTKIIPMYYNSSYPEENYVYDASYVKLREVSLSYSLPSKLLSNIFFNDITFTLNGSNLWIIHKNLPYADPEAGASSGNLQGFQTGVLPTAKEYSFNVKLNF